MSEGDERTEDIEQHQTTSSNPLAHQAPAGSPAAAFITVLTHNLGSSHTRTLRVHPQHSRYTPRCPSVVPWTPCSGVEWRVFEPTIRFGEAVGAQAACEPGGGGCGGVPVHPARLHSHRTSPAQALLTILADICLIPTPDLLSHCHRRVCGVRFALAEQ